MPAYHSDPKIKAKYLARVQAHRLADELIRGEGWNNGRGCAIGCTLEAYDHSRYPIELGIPVVIAHLEDTLFERLPKNAAMLWPERVLSAIRPGADLSLIWPKFAVWLLRTELKPYYTKKTEPAILAVAGLYDRKIAGDEPSEEAWAAGAATAEAAWAAGAAVGVATGAAEGVATAEAAWAARAEAAWAARAAGAAAWAAAVGVAAAGAAAAEAGAVRAVVVAAVGVAAVGVATVGAAACVVRMADKMIELLEST